MGLALVAVAVVPILREHINVTETLTATSSETSAREFQAPPCRPTGPMDKASG